MRKLIIGFILIACISANAQTEIRNTQTILEANFTGSIAFNNSDNPLACTFTGHIIETTDCTALKSAK